MELFLNNRISHLHTFDTNAHLLLSRVKKGFFETLVLSSSRIAEFSQTSRGLRVDYRATLLVEGSSVEISSDHYLKEGDRLQLRTVTGGGLIAFGSVSHPRADLRLPLALIDHGLRHSLPVQESMMQLYPMLKAIADSPPALEIPLEIKSGAQSLISSFPTLDQVLRVESFRQAMFNSGSFLESKLVHAARFVEQNRRSGTSEGFLFDGDFKAELSVLIRNLKEFGVETNLLPPSRQAPQTDRPLVYSPARVNTPNRKIASKPSEEPIVKEEPFVGILLKKLSKLLASTLAKIKVNQLVSLEHQCQSCNEAELPINSWLFDLPIYDDGNVNVLSVQIEQQPKEGEGGELLFLWTVKLNFEFNRGGRMLFELSLLKDTISAEIWSEPESAYQQVSDSIEELKDEFRYAGAKVSEVHSHFGVPEQLGPLLKHRLVDLHT